MNLQGENNLRKARIEKKEVLDKIEPLVV